jgi:hypothetical protein
MKRLGLLSLTVLASLGLATSAFANGWNGHGEAYTTNTGIGWYYSAEHRAFFRGPESFVQVSDVPDTEWTSVPTCTGNDPSGGGDVCAAALCTTADGEPGVSFWVFSRPLDPPGSSWSLEGTQCVPGERRVDLADVEAEILRIVEDKFRQIAEPEIVLAPQASGLVNLPVLAWTEDPGPVTLEIEQPLPGVISASPTYEWLWSNGTTATGPGRPYSPAMSPTDDSSSYVSSVFEQRGEASVALTVTWRGTVTVPGVPAVDISPLVYTASAGLPIEEARSVLVDGRV